MTQPQQTAKGQARKQRAQALLQQGRLKQARTLYEKLGKENPRDAECQYMLGSIAGQQGRYETAVAYLQRTLQLQPDTLIAYCGLGAALRGLGRHAEAEAAFRHALRLKPGFTDVQLELAGCLLHQGQHAEARELLESVLARDPGCATALHGLGEIHHAGQDLERAARCYRDALKADPKRAATHNRLGFLLYTLGRLDEAVAHLRMAVALETSDIDAHRNLGSCLLAAGQLEAAQQAFETGLRRAPHDPGLCAGLASLLERCNQHQAAYDRLKPLLDKGIRHPGVGIALAGICHKLQRCDEACHYLAALSQDPALADPTRQQVLYALGRLYDRQGRYEEAFRQFAAANDLSPNRFSEAEHFATTAAIRATFSGEFLARAPRSSLRSQRPVFIVGMPRSGTSLTEQILGCHREVYAAGELPAVGDHATRLARRLAPPGFPNGFRKLDQGMLEETARAYLDELAGRDAAARLVTDKMPQNFIHLGLIALLFPKARVIHCVRDPRDTCLSIYFQHFNEAHAYATNLHDLGAYYRAYRQLMDHWKAVLDLPILDLHYEDLIENQETTTRRLLDFLGLAWDPGCLSFHEAERFVATSSYDQVRQPIYRQSLARWKHYENHIAPLLEALA